MKEMVSCLYGILFKSKADRMIFCSFVLFMLMMVAALRLNDNWAKQRESISPGIIGQLHTNPNASMAIPS